MRIKHDSIHHYCKKLKPVDSKYQKLPHAIPIIMIMAVASGLRFYGGKQIPFSYDEFSSLYRSSFSTLNEVIEKGILTDLNPPLCQLLYFFQIKVGGIGTLWIKFPYLLMGITSVWLLYRLGQKSFNQTAGLLSASLFAVLQESVIHSQIARSYSLGCFLCLCSASILTTIFSNAQRVQLWKLIMTGILLASCALVHHFSMLLALLLFCSFLCLKWKTHQKEIFIIGITGFVCYIPCLYILFAQLEFKGAATTLSVPKSDFLVDYFHYLFHFSPLLISIVVLLFCLNLFFFNRKWNWKLMLISISLFVLSYLAGHFYSVFVGPVLQFRALYFAVPFFFLALFSFCKDYPLQLKIIAVVTILFIGSYTLIVERQHYKIFYTSGFKGVMNDAQQLSKNGHTQTNLLAYSPYILDYTKLKTNNTIDIISPDSTWTMNDFAKLVAECNTVDFNYGATMQYYQPPIEVLGMLLKKYGSCQQQHNYFNSWFYHFSMEKNAYSNHYLLNGENLEYNIGEELNQHLENDKLIVDFWPKNEYGYGCKLQLPNEQINHCDWIIAHAEIECQQAAKSNSSLVLESSCNGKNITWQCSEVKNFCLENHPITDVYVAYGYNAENKNDQPSQLIAYIWNRGDAMKIHSLDFYHISGNPMMYSLIAPVEKLDIAKLPFR